MPSIPARNEIVVYQPDETVRMEALYVDESIWLSQGQIAELFGTQRPAVTKHLSNIYASGELEKETTCSILEHIGSSGQKYKTTYYNLDAILSVGYRVNTSRATQFRKWATGVLRDYLLRGYAVNNRLVALEERVDRRLAQHDRDIVDLKEKVDYFVQTQTPPRQGLFFDGQLWDACSLVERLVARAKNSILLIDSWVGPGTLDMLAKKRSDVAVEIVTSSNGKLAATDIAKFNAQYPTLSVRTATNFHDRFLILDDKELYHIGASLKDLGRKCFAFSTMEPSLIPAIKSRL